MPTLSDGTPIQIQDETYHQLLEAVETAFHKNDQEVLVKIAGYQSKSTKKVADITLNIVFDYGELVTNAMMTVVNFSPETADRSIASTAIWKQAHDEVLQSLLDSLHDKNKRNHTTGSAESISDVLPSVRAAFTSGLVQFQGIIEEYKLIDEGTKKKVNSRPKTLAKQKIYEGTFRAKEAIGSFKTLALEKGRFESIQIGDKTFSADAFFSDVIDPAIRLMTGEKGHSKRIILTEAGANAEIELHDVGNGYKTVKEYTHSGKAKKISELRNQLKIGFNPVALAQITTAKSIKTETLVAIATANGIEIKEISSGRIAPSSGTTTFVEVKREHKKMNDGEKLIFIRPSSSQIVANLKWDNHQDLDLCAFVELKNGQKWILQPLGETFGALSQAPYVLHSGDDRHGNSNDGEFLRVDMHNIQHIKRIVFYSMIYSGANNWNQTNAVVNIDVPGHANIEIPLNEQNAKDGRNECALCTLEVKGNSLAIERNMTFHSGALIRHDGRDTVDMDVAYDFGLTWVPGTKN